MNGMRERLHPDAVTVTGKTVGENIAGRASLDSDVIGSLAAPIKAENALAILRGNLAPKGAILKPAAATPRLMKHRGLAVVFESVEDMDRRIDDPDLAVTEDSVLVLKGIGPRGYPGMPELGNIRIPARLLEKGVRDMVRISDGRMSGTAYGTVVLHVSPEAAVGGPLSLVEDGDPIELDIPAGRLHLDVPDDVLEERRKRRSPAEAKPARGYERLFVEHVMQAHEGIDFDFLVGRTVGERSPRRSL
jgi:dihydroxy-acid dehydratase